MRVRWERIRNLRAREFVLPLNMEPNFCLVFSTWCEFLLFCAKFRLHPDDCRVKTGSENSENFRVNWGIFVLFLVFCFGMRVLCFFVFAIVVVAWPVLAHEIFFWRQACPIVKLVWRSFLGSLQWPAHLPVMCSLLLGSLFIFWGTWTLMACVVFFCERVIRFKRLVA